MISTGIRDLKNNLSRYIRRVARGERFLVTDRGRVVAELRQPDVSDGTADVSEAPYQRLVDSGVIRPATSTGDPLADWPRFKLARGTAAALIDADRGEA